MTADLLLPEQHAPGLTLAPTPDELDLYRTATAWLRTRPEDSIQLALYVLDDKGTARPDWAVGQDKRELSKLVDRGDIGNWAGLGRPKIPKGKGADEAYGIAHEWAEAELLPGDWTVDNPRPSTPANKFPWEVIIRSRMDLRQSTKRRKWISCLDVALALSGHGKASGGDIFPGMESLAQELGNVSKRVVTEHRSTLIASGWIQDTGGRVNVGYGINKGIPVLQCSWPSLA